MMTTMRRLFGGSSDSKLNPGKPDSAAAAAARPADARKERAKTEEAFKTAVRDGDVTVMEEMLASKRLSPDDELGGGRGLLQFAVMTNSIKAVRLLIERGASATIVDSLGASADALARKSGSANMARALHPV